MEDRPRRTIDGGPWGTACRPREDRDHLTRLTRMCGLVAEGIASGGGPSPTEGHPRRVTSGGSWPAARSCVVSCASEGIARPYSPHGRSARRFPGRLPLSSTEPWIPKAAPGAPMEDPPTEGHRWRTTEGGPLQNQMGSSRVSYRQRRLPIHPCACTCFPDPVPVQVTILLTSGAAMRSCGERPAVHVAPGTTLPARIAALCCAAACGAPNRALQRRSALVRGSLQSMASPALDSARGR